MFNLVFLLIGYLYGNSFVVKKKKIIMYVLMLGLIFVVSIV